MGKIKRRRRRKVLEGPGPKLPAPPPSSRGAPYGTSEVTTERWLEVTEVPRDRQDETSGAMAAPTVAGEEPRGGASSGKSPQQEGRPGTGASSGENSQQREAPGKRRLRRKRLEEPGPRLPAQPPSSRGAPHGANKVMAEKRLAFTKAPRDRQDKTPEATAVSIGPGESL